MSVVILGGARTPIGAFQGSLSEVPVTDLGSTAIQAALSKAGLNASQVQETWMGNVLTAGVGQAPARQAAKAAGIPDSTPATTVGKVCGSGLQAVILGAKSIMLGDAGFVLAGGMESMSRAPYLLLTARGGFRMGHAQATDSMIHDGLWDPYKNWHMGNAGELCAKEYGFTREAQDEFATQSYRYALDALEKGLSGREIAAVSILKKGETTQVTTDDEPQRVKFDKMPGLKPAFDKAGTITAANASKLNDGAAALVLASEAEARKVGLKPLARIVSYASHAQAPEWFTTAPIGAMQAALSKAGWKASEVDVFEINEAFAVVPMAAMKELSIPREKVNPRGGAIALGHPIGASGARVLVTLIDTLIERNQKRGVASLCIGGGEALAIAVEIT